MSPSTTNNSFGARRGKWLDQIDADPECTCAYFRVFWHVGQRLDTETFTARPGHPYLAEKARVDTKTVQRALNWAESRGHIQCGEAVGRSARTITPILTGHNVQSSEPSTGHSTGHSPRITHGNSRENGPISQFSHKNKKEEDFKNGLPRKESKPSSTDSPLQPACDVPRPRAGWWDRLDEPPVLTGAEQAALGRLATMNGSGSALTGVSS